MTCHVKPPAWRPLATIVAVLMFLLTIVLLCINLYLAGLLSLALFADPANPRWNYVLMIAANSAIGLSLNRLSRVML